MLISDNYKKLNTELHQENAGYGTSSTQYLRAIANFAMQLEADNIIDYGCGKGMLAKEIGDKIEVVEYDPAIEGKDKDPKACDMLVCVDVMEHIEPECVNDVISHMAEKTLKGAFITICTVPAKKVLSDGRNAHICLESLGWWVDKFANYFGHIVVLTGDKTFALMVQGKTEPQKEKSRIIT